MRLAFCRGDHWSSGLKTKRGRSLDLFFALLRDLSQHAPSFIARASRKVAIPIGSCVGGAAKAKAFALDALIIQHHGAAVKIGLTRADPIAAGAAQSLSA